VLKIKVRKHLSDFTLDLDVSCPYPVTAIFGPSGSGKTTLLNLVSGLDQPDAGEISLDGTLLYSSAQGVNLPPEKRRIGYVFQDDLLFPHLSVDQNLLFGYDLQAPAIHRFEPDAIIDLLQLRPLRSRRIAHLSGGEKQRVALGRAILSSPRLLIMDEPLASLDQSLKDRIIPYLRNIRTSLNIPMLYVSHSVAEILELTGQVIVLEAGSVLAHGDFFDIAHHARVLPLLEAHGFENVLPVEVVDQTHVLYGTHLLRIPPCDRSPKTKIFIGIRANDIILSRSHPAGLSIRNALPGRILDIAEAEGRRLVYVDTGKRIAAEVTQEAIDDLGLKPGDSVICLIKTHSIRVGPDVEVG
jgi:molybdate transport system ATP-binding protein